MASASRIAAAVCCRLHVIYPEWSRVGGDGLLQLMHGELSLPQAAGPSSPSFVHRRSLVDGDASSLIGARAAVLPPGTPPRSRHHGRPATIPRETNPVHQRWRGRQTRSPRRHVSSVRIAPSRHHRHHGAHDPGSRSVPSPQSLPLPAAWESRQPVRLLFPLLQYLWRHSRRFSRRLSRHQSRRHARRHFHRPFL